MLNYLTAAGTFAGIYALIALGLNIIWGMTGMVNLGVIGYYAFGAYASAILSLELGIPVPLSALIAVLITAGVGAATTLGVVRVKDDYLAIVTLGFAETVRLVAENEVWLTNGTDGLAQIPQPGLDVLGPAFGYCYFAFVLLTVCAALFLLERLRGAPFGRVLRAIRDDAPVVAAAGKNVVQFQMVALAIGAGLMGLSGAIYAHYIGFVSPDTFGTQRLIYIFFAISLGGKGNNFGVVLGTFLLVLFDESARFAISSLPGLSAVQIGAGRQFIIGVCFLLVLRFRPRGVLPEARPAYGPE
ncbi:branched-chain amino acid ABC transporter permease [Bosea sp. (in: a-proteobacteria)]|uniref:branched-chain amino acid ABC transporter permease n=1 Tax=Bosea sp. (in: a-proteobacteria) TaxID=1871050 RepID=UPI00260E65AB|nr:branched-chain amino acid ABC transporter permease [Bosea sp. (in: a-proteobacteria)]MCO5091323.1 branched-chain amino acid ABC transporter permease [Bosea sp. (in: a-proteobacteria)]